MAFEKLPNAASARPMPLCESPSPSLSPEGKDSFQPLRTWVAATDTDTLTNLNFDLEGLFVLLDSFVELTKRVESAADTCIRCALARFVTCDETISTVFNGF